MNRIIFIFIFAHLSNIFASDIDTVCSKKGLLYVSGKPINKQIYLKNDTSIIQISKFDNWEIIEDISISKNDSFLLIFHKPDKNRYHKLSLMKMDSFSIIKSIEPGFGGRYFWTNQNNILHIWGCGSPCKVFRIYDLNLNVIAAESEACMTGIIEADIIVSFPCVYSYDGVFKIWSLIDGKKLLEKSFINKYGVYYCWDIDYINGKINVILQKENNDGQKIIIKEVLDY